MMIRRKEKYKGFFIGCKYFHAKALRHKEKYNYCTASYELKVISSVGAFIKNNYFTKVNIVKKSAYGSTYYGEKAFFS